MTAVAKYCSAACGSNLWDLGSKEAVMLTYAWRTGHTWPGPAAPTRWSPCWRPTCPLPSLRASMLHFRRLLISPSTEVQGVGKASDRTHFHFCGKS